MTITQTPKEFEISKHNDKYVIWETRMSGQKIAKGIFQNSLRKNSYEKAKDYIRENLSKDLLDEFIRNKTIRFILM